MSHLLFCSTLSIPLALLIIGGSSAVSGMLSVKRCARIRKAMIVVVSCLTVMSSEDKKSDQSQYRPGVNNKRLLDADTQLVDLVFLP